jgi:uncharacterized protein
MGNIIELMDGQYLYMVDQNRIINATIKDHFLTHAQALTIPIKDLQIDEELLREKVQSLPMMTLEVTQECNLRCKYCIYNNCYEQFRPFTSHRMSWETAKKAIDYVYSLVEHRTEKNFDIGFYGGEPLLNVPVIEQAVEYGKQIFKGWNLTFSMTSNITALNKDIAKFLINNNIRLNVSLDGSKENHDAKRVFVNGQGTHDTVMKNLKMLKDLDSGYFQKKISFTAVHSLELPLENVRRFYDNNELAKGHPLRVNNVSKLNTSYYEKHPWDKNEKEKEFQQLEHDIFSKLLKQEELTAVESFYRVNASMEIESHTRRSFSTGAQTCLFDSRIYIDATGGFHICERINDKFSIGNIDEGLNFAKMLDIIKSFTRLIKQNCLNCDVRFLCTRCFCSFGGDGTFEIPDDFCAGKRRSIVKGLEKHIKYQEEGLIQ